MKTFKSYLETCKPLPWTEVKDHSTKWLVGNHALAINYIRFKHIVEAIKKYKILTNQTILDIGVYPGIMPQIFNEYFTLEKTINYYGAGLGFDASFIQKMNDYGVSLIECDLDPRLHLNKERKTSIPLGEKTVDLVIFTDVIEHFYDPFYVLQEINRVSKFGSTMILTTDNITRFDSILALILGRSCNVPLVESNLFYNGDWRPHYREYSKNELCQLLSWAGFEVIEHQFYEADFGSYRIINNKLVRKGLSEISLKGRLVNTVRRLTTKVLPYLRDNHILVVKKNKSYEEMIKTSPKIVNNIDAWNKQRKIYSK